MALDDRLRRDLEAAGRPGDPSGIYEDLIRRRERRVVMRRVKIGVLAVVVFAGSVGGVLALTRVFERSPHQTIGEVPTVSPTQTPSPTQEPSPSGPRGSQDIGLPWPVCNVSSIEGEFASGTMGTAYVATVAGDVGPCPQPQEGDNVLAVDWDSDGRPDGSYGPIPCTLDCRVFSTPDLDGDGTVELLVVQEGGAVVGIGVYDVTVEGPRSTKIEPVEVAAPADPEGGFRAGEQAILWLGGDEFELYTLRCGDSSVPDGPGVIATAAEARPHDSIDALWYAHEVTLVLRDGRFRIVGVRDYTEPVSHDGTPPSFGAGEELCGSRLGP